MGSPAVLPESLTVKRIKLAIPVFLVAAGLFAPSVAAAEPLRITQLQRCGDVLDPKQPTFCVQASGLGSGGWQARLNGAPVRIEQRSSVDDLIRFQLDADDADSGPLWLEQNGETSNPVWLSLGSSYVLAAGEDEVVENADGLTTYLNLVSVIIEEQHDGAEEARRLADKYDAKVVGAIPPLNTYQLRLPASNLDERDAVVLRLGNEVSVDAVVIEESGAEKGIERDTDTASATENEEWASNRFLDAVNFYQRRLKAGEDRIRTHPIRLGVIERDVDFDTPDFSGYRAIAERTKPAPAYTPAMLKRLMATALL